MGTHSFKQKLRSLLIVFFSRQEKQFTLKVERQHSSWDGCCLQAWLDPRAPDDASRSLSISIFSHLFFSLRMTSSSLSFILKIAFLLSGRVALDSSCLLYPFNSRSSGKKDGKSCLSPSTRIFKQKPERITIGDTSLRISWGTDTQLLAQTGTV